MFRGSFLKLLTLSILLATDFGANIARVDLHRWSLDLGTTVRKSMCNERFTRIFGLPSVQVLGLGLLLDIKAAFLSTCRTQPSDACPLELAFSRSLGSPASLFVVPYLWGENLLQGAETPKICW